MDLNEALTYMLDGDALLFVGAGFSINNENLNNEKLPLTNKLSRNLQQLSGLPENDIDESLDIQITSQYYMKCRGKASLVEVLRDKFTVSKALEWQQKVVGLNWERIYTTNYDNVLEVASDEARYHRRPINLGSYQQVKTTDARKQIVHLNGYVDSIDEESLETSTKLTSKSYTNTNFIDSPWRTEFEIDIEHSKAIFFLGFSLDYDLDLKRVIATNKNLREKIFFINGAHLNVIKKASLAQFGTVLDLDAEDFSRKISDKEKDYVPIQEENFKTYSFVKNKYIFDKAPVRDQDISDLLFYGKLQENKMFSTINSQSYVIKRKAIDNVLKCLDRCQLIYVHSHLGNGKSVFLKQLECELINKNYSVYRYNDNPNAVFEDVEKLKGSNENHIIIIDDYYSIRSQFKNLTRLNKENFKFIIAGRSSINDNIYSSFVEQLNFESSKTMVVNLDMIDKDEQNGIFNLVLEHNLWGRKAADSTSKKKRYIQRISKNGFNNVAIELVKSNNIVSKMYKLYAELNNKQQEFIVALLINNTIRANLTIAQLLAVTDNTIFTQDIVENSNFKEFVDIDNNKIIIGSSVASRELLKLEINKEKIISVMEKMLKTSSKIDYNRTYEYFKRELVSFSNFRLVMGGTSQDNLDNYAVQYFESIKNTKFTKENPFFWLQYGIQKLNAKKYDLANIFFENAESYAQKKGFDDFYQLNSNRARGLVERMLEENTNVDDAGSTFEKAHYLLISDLDKSRNNKNYQLSQGTLYESYYNRYYDLMGNNDKVSFKVKVNQFKKYLDDYIDMLLRKGNNIDGRLLKSSDSIARILN